MYVAGSPLNAIARQRPDMEFGQGIVPVRRAGDKPQTFAGGFSWGVPFGTKNPDVSWATLQSLMSEAALAAYVEAAAGPARAGGGVYIPGFTTVQDLDRKFRQQYATGSKSIDTAWDFIIDQMKYARVRPVSPAAADAWDALNETWTNVLARKQTPKEACDAMNAKVQLSLDTAYGKK
jgi:maltose-binding protein MalE